MPLALVTGGSRGIGRAIVGRLARDGADVAFVYRRDATAAAEVEAGVRALGRRAIALQADLGDPAQVASALARLGDERVDFFVANAAATAFKPLLEVKPHHVEKTFAITIGAFLQIVQAIAPRMPATGRIVAISGMDTHRYVAGHGILAAAKAALEALTRYLAVELGPRGITVNGVSPGFIETDSSRLYMKSLGRDWSDAVAAITAMTPVRRTGTVDDVAALVAYLVSDAAGFLTGQTVVIDGGLTIVSPLSRLVDEKPPR
jgi:enoyl-[acyl-carrier protein] reductase III